MSTGNPNQVRETLSSSSATNLPPVFLPSLLMPRLCSLSLSLSTHSVLLSFRPSPHLVRQPFTHKNSSGFVSLARATFFCFSLYTRSCTPRLRSCSSILLHAALFDSFNDDLSMDDTMNILSAALLRLCVAEGLSRKWTSSNFLVSYFAPSVDSRCSRNVGHERISK